MLRVIIADDHPIVRVGQRVVIEANGKCKVVGEADGPDQLLGVLSTTACDVLVTDFAMPGGQQADGYSLLSLLRRQYPNVPVILVTMFANVATLRAAFAHGARAVVAKSASAKELPLAIKAVCAARPSPVNACGCNWWRRGQAISPMSRSCPARRARWCACWPAA